MEHSQEYIDALEQINDQFEALFEGVTNSAVANAMGNMKTKSVWSRRDRKDFDSRLLAGIQVAKGQKIHILAQEDLDNFKKNDVTLELYLKEIKRLRKILNDNGISF